MTAPSPNPTPAAADAPKTKRYIVDSPVDFNNERYEIGAPIYLTAKDAGPLLAVAAIREPAAKQAAAE